MIYVIGTSQLNSKYQMPRCFDDFQVDHQLGDSEYKLAYCSLEVIKAPVGISETVHTHANRYDIFHLSDGSWVFMVENCDEQMHVSSAYDHFEFYSPEIVEMEDEWSGNLDELHKSAGSFNLLILLALRCHFLAHDVLSIHGACVSLEEKAYLFSGVSGTGKSTRAKQWVDQLGASLISGDRPNFYIADQKFYGVPWDGKEGIYRSVSFPAGAVFDVKRSDKTAIYKLSHEQAYRALLIQNFIPMWDPMLAMKSMLLLKKMVTMVPVYRLYCDKDPDSAQLVYDMLQDQTHSILPNIEEQLADKPNISLNPKASLQKVKHILRSGECEIMTIMTDAAVTESDLEDKDVFVPNEISQFLFSCLQQGTQTKEELLKCILKEYNVKEQDARADLYGWIEMMQAYEFLTLSK